jgi:hypothetical protein
MEKPKVLKGKGMGGSDILVEEETGKVLMDGYMDPAHLRLGDEGYKKLQEGRVKTIGAEILEYIRSRHPDYNAFPKESKGKINAEPEGTLTEFIYEIKTNQGRLCNRLFPRTLVRIISDHGMMPYSMINIISQNLFQDKNLRDMAIDLATKNQFMFE